MEAIYQAILLIPQQPSKATKILLKIQRSEPRFLQYMKTMAIELYDRYAPRSLQQQIEYETICKHLIVIFSRMMRMDFEDKGHEIYLSIENYYHWMLEILLCDHIPLILKKTLEPSFKLIIESICYQPSRITQFADHMLNNSMNSSSSLFVYIEALLESSVSQLKKIESIKEIYQFLFAVLDLQYKALINFYRSKYMESEICQTDSNKVFHRRIIENEYMLKQIYKIFKFFQSIFNKNQQIQSFYDLISQIFFNPDIARYLSCVLKMQKDFFQNYEKPNAFNLKMILMTSLNRQLKNAINSCKSHCLSILKIILNVSDKDFNLFCTDKLLMREMFNISELVINQLLICSQERVFNALQSELDIKNIIASMLSLLSVIIKFKDLKPLLSSLDVQKLIRLTFFYSKTFEEEQNLYKSNPQEYFYFNLSIYNNSPDKDGFQLVDLIEQLSIRQKSVEFIITMNQKMQGFHNIILDICCDIIILENSLKNYNDLQAKVMFMQKYSLSQEIFTCFNTQTALSVVTVLMQETWDNDDKYNKMYLILSKIQIHNMNNLEKYRLYICLSFNHQIFIHLKGYRLFYETITNVYKLVHKQSSVAYAGYFFIEKLLKSNSNDKEYDFFIEKLFDDFIEVFSVARCSNPFQTINNVLEINYIKRDFINLDWINRSIQVLNKRIINDMNRGHDDSSKLVLAVYAELLKVAEEKISQNKSMPYPSFSDQCIIFHEQLIAFVSEEKFRYSSRIIQEESFENEDHLVVNFCKILKYMIIQQVPLRDDQYDLIIGFTLFLLQKSFKNEVKLNKISFELLYQLIHVKIYSFDQKMHSAILAWMKDNYYQDEVSLNKICIILQQLYYYIHNNSNQNQQNFIYFYSSIIQIIQKKFLQLLIQYHNYANALNQQTDINIKRINELNINNSNKKTNPITIIRLFNTILLNPYFDITIIRKVHDMLKKYNYQIIPSYDLAILVLSLESLFKRSRNISVVQCFRFTTELLGYNSNNPQLKCRKQTQDQIYIAMMMQGLRTSLTNTDPYQLYSILTQRYIFSTQDNYYVSQKNNQVEINIMSFIEDDTYFRNLVKKLTLVRSVNNKTRMILKVRKTEE